MAIFAPKKPRLEDQILWIKTAKIKPNPCQPRKVFDKAALDELAQSISDYGILNPLNVRRVGSGYELIAGERRLRAALMVGLPQVPCLLIEADEQKSSLLALVENLQRRDLDYFEEAAGYRRLIDVYGLTQEEVAKKVGKTQPAVANKLRLLKLSNEEMSKIAESGLTERHARALLRVEDIRKRFLTLEYIISAGLNVRQTEEYIEELLTPQEKREKKEATGSLLIRDVRFFLNTVNHAVDVMRKSGFSAKCEREETEEGMTVRIYIPRTKKTT